jgi:DNA-directed RNA polymerase beta' subunit
MHGFDKRTGKVDLKIRPYRKEKLERRDIDALQMFYCTRR